MKKFFAPLGMGMGMALLVAGCTRESSITPPEAQQPIVDTAVGTVTFATNAPQLALINEETVQPRTVAVSHVTGRLYWDEDVTARIFTPVGGRVTSLHAELGDTVVAGQTLAEIDSPDFGQALAAAQTAEANFAAAEKTFKRSQELLTHGSAAAKDVEAAEAAFRASQAERDRALAQLNNYGGRLDSTNSIYQLRTPISGELVDRNISIGQEVRPDMMLGNVPQTFNPLFTVSDPTKLWLQLDVAEGDLGTLRKGLPLHITTQAFPDQVFDGTLDNIADTMDPNTRTIKVRGTVRNPDKLLKAEMYVMIDVLEKTGQPSVAGVEVPSRALFLRNNDYYIFVEQTPGQFRRTKVKVGIERDGRVPVLEGVEAGQKVVSDGALLLQALADPSS